MAKKFPPLVPGTTAVSQHYRNSISQEANSTRAENSRARFLADANARASTDLGGTLPAPPNAPSFSDYLKEEKRNQRRKITLNEQSDGIPFKTSLDEHGEFLLTPPEPAGPPNLATQLKQTLTIKHIATGFEVSFPAFLDTFNDAYNSDWTQESVFGRMDPIATFNGTDRTLSLGWHVPASSYDHAEGNLGAVNQLISYLYPLYDGDITAGGATAINQSPLVRISFGNLVVSSVSGDGLLGYCHGVTFDPAMEYGMFNELTATGPRYFAKTFRLNLELKVLHDHKLGYRVSDSTRDKITEKYDWSSALTRRRNRQTITTKYSFNDTEVQWNNFPYHTRVDAGDSNRSTSRTNILNSVEPDKIEDDDTSVFAEMFNRERLGTYNIRNALLFGNISDAEADILGKGSNVVAGEWFRDPNQYDGWNKMDY